MNTKDTIFIEQTISASLSKVFKAFTTKKGYQGWWAKECDVDCHLNGMSSIRFKKPAVIEEMIFKTVQVVQNEKLIWICESNNVFPSWVGSTICFSIKEKDGKTLLTFMQTAPIKSWGKHQDFENSVAGWEFFLASLKHYCETEKGSPWG